VADGDPRRRENGRAPAAGGNGSAPPGTTELRATQSVNRTVGFLVALFAFVALGSFLLLDFGLESLSTFRAWASAESHWSKAQKDALLALTRYLDTRDPRDDVAFLEAMAVAEADRRARLEM
jgi:hypothetical protein